MQTTCKRGHDLTVPENVYTYPDGRKRQCAQCLRESPRRHGPPAEGPRTHCINGHPIDLDDSYWAPDGRRFCRECIRARWQRDKAAKRQASTHAGTTTDA